MTPLVGRVYKVLLVFHCNCISVFTVYSLNNGVTLNSGLGSLKVAPVESLGTVFYSHSTATMAVSLAVLTQYTNVIHPLSQTDTARRAALVDSIARQK